jgi:DNA-binding transcriptional ArsR family regulator
VAVLVAILRRAGLVTSRREGSTGFYAIRAASIVELLASAKALFDVVLHGAVTIPVNQTYPLRDAAQAFGVLMVGLAAVLAVVLGIPYLVRWIRHPDAARADLANPLGDGHRERIEDEERPDEERDRGQQRGRRLEVGGRGAKRCGEVGRGREDVRLARQALLERGADGGDRCARREPEIGI